MKKLFFDCGTRDTTASLGIFALRAMVGLMMLAGHGIPKIQNYATLKKFFYVPEFLPLSWAPACLIACIVAEVGASAMVIIGFATRPAAFILGFSMVVASFGKLGLAPWFSKTATLVESKETGLLYLMVMIAIILSGAGAYSLDAMLYRDPKRRRW